MSDLSETEFSALREVVTKWDEGKSFPVEAKEVEEALEMGQQEVQIALQGLIDRELISLTNFGDDLIMSVGNPTSEARALLREGP